MRLTPVILRLGGAFATAAFGLAAVAVASAPGMAMAADAAHPTVVELFQSQGCSSCPPANANVMAVSDRDILALSWQVTYWDNQAWKDTFDSPGFTQRQWDYAHAFHRGEVFTPQVVINGRHDLVGFDREALNQGDPRRRPWGGRPHHQPGGRSRHRLRPGAAGPGAAGALRSQRRAGGDQRWRERRPRAAHKNVVRQMARLGRWDGGTHTYTLPAPSRPGLKTAVLVQSGPGGPIVAAARG